MGGSEHEHRARQIESWLRARIAQFPPLVIVDVRASVQRAPDGGPVIELIVLLGRPLDRLIGWPVEPLFAMIDAVNAESRRREYGMFVQVLPQPAASGAA